MKKSRGIQGPDKLVEAVVKGIQEVKGRDIVVLDLRSIPNSVCEHFVICHGDSDRQVEAIANSVEKVVFELANEKPWHVEGMTKSEWVLLDYVNVVVHVFHRDKRLFYGIEDLWADAIRRTYDNVA
ncbi:MAG: ribosome silencing factor [Flavobacteriales bacterium]|nr:ribosome silencing factor [Flavobacteriales bacterium]